MWQQEQRRASGSFGRFQNIITSKQLPGSWEKVLAPNNLVAPRYGCLSDSDLGEKVHFFNRAQYGIWRCVNTTLRYEATPQPNRGPTIALRFVLCGFVRAVVCS